MVDTIPQTAELAQYIPKLEAYEDYLTFYQQLDEDAASMNWTKADTLLQMSNKLGEGALRALSKDLKQPPSTVSHYVRTAKAFPPDKREPMLSFSIHLQASFADSYDEKTKEFDGITRFDIIQEAVDQGMSVRRLMTKLRELKAAKTAPNAETAQMIADAEDKAHTMMRYLGSMRDKVKKGDKDAYQIILNIYQTIPF